MIYWKGLRGEPRESQKHNDAKSGNVLAKWTQNENSMEEEQSP